MIYSEPAFYTYFHMRTEASQQRHTNIQVVSPPFSRPGAVSSKRAKFGSLVQSAPIITFLNVDKLIQEASNKNLARHREDPIFKAHLHELPRAAWLVHSTIIIAYYHLLEICITSAFGRTWYHLA